MIGKKVSFSISINIWSENPSQCWEKSQFCHNGLLQELKWDLKVKSYGKRDCQAGAPCSVPPTLASILERSVMISFLSFTQAALL